MWSKRKQEASRYWAAWETTDFCQWVADEVQRRSAAGRPQPAEEVAIEVLEQVREEMWPAPYFGRLAKLSYKRTLAIAKAAESHHGAVVPLAAGVSPSRRKPGRTRHRAA